MKRIILVILISVAAASAVGCEPEAANCDGVSVAPGDDVTGEFQDALAWASQHPVAGLRGPADGAPQGRVHLEAGEYRIKSIQVPSNVRVEIDPGATLRPVQGYEPTPRSDWGLLNFGDFDAPAENISITTGDGCGGPGDATGDNKPSNTGEYGNVPGPEGMANAPVPFSSEWDTDAMWVMDLDPARTGAGAQMTGFYFRWTNDVTVTNVFTIQNPSRTESADGVPAPVAGATSRTTAMMFVPPRDAQWVPDEAAQKLPHRVTVVNHYNILSPSGQGANQVRACIDCKFVSVYSHGGVPLRIETDGIHTLGPGCAGTGVDGQGFKEYAKVDRLEALHVEGTYGNRVVLLNAHCLANGSVSVSNVKGTSMYALVSVGNDPDTVVGGFGPIRLENVRGCGGAAAQNGKPKASSYLVQPSRSAIEIEPRTPPFDVTFSGTFTWPAKPAVGGLADGLIPQDAGVVVDHSMVCE